MDFKGAITGDHILFLLKGLLITLEVALIAIVLSFIIGSVIGILRYENTCRLTSIRSYS